MQFMVATARLLLLQVLLIVIRSQILFLFGA
jgi:hypothetical protein